ncbi:ionotropic receptor 75a-like [Topomyia yanbarensis]|uniref:ionotropic receptor 75a-like n=1 Tax=Topomyia yanbarensis TaxID=2498891 RepID=UPI00273A8CB3|nr:ionotropic receptor 75a-like [Topomyia yanbarensis]
MRIASVGTWSIGSRIDWVTGVNSYQSRRNLMGLPLWSIISTLEAPRNVTLGEYLESLDPPVRYSSDRFGYQISKLLSRQLNFRLKIIHAKGWSLNAIGTNSSSGVIGQIQQNLVDFSSTPLVLDTNRVNSFEQTVPLTAIKFLTYFRHPRKHRSGNMILQPFHGLVWTSVIIILLVSAITLMVALCVQRRVEAVTNFQISLAVLGLLCQQGYSENTSIVSSRIVIITAILFSLIIYQFYTTTIISSLLVPPPKYIRTAEQLLASDLKYSIEDIYYNRHYFNVSFCTCLHFRFDLICLHSFQTTKKTTDIQLYRQKVLPNKLGFVNATTGIALVKQGGYAFLCDTSYGNAFIADTFDQREICELQEIALFSFRWVHLVVPKGSPLRELFRVTLRHLQETGLSEYYRKKFLLERPRCVGKNLAYTPIGSADIVGFYWLMVAGIMISFTVLLVELIEFRLREHLERKLQTGRYPVWLN